MLHIVISHSDLAKIYALVEQMLKSELTLDGGMLPFDIPNGMGETPLMVAVQKGQQEVVDYLLEVRERVNDEERVNGGKEEKIWCAEQIGMNHLQNE